MVISNGKWRKKGTESYVNSTKSCILWLTESQSYPTPKSTYLYIKINCSLVFLIFGKALTMMYFGASQVVLMVKNPPANAGDIRNLGLIPGCGRSPGEGNGYPLQYSCLENTMDRGAWCAIVHWVTKSQTQPSDFTHTYTMYFYFLYFIFNSLNI